MSNDILITTSSFQTYYDQYRALEASGFNIVLNPYKKQLSDDEITSLLQDHDVVGLLAGVENLSGEILKNAPNLKVISRCGIGIDNVDVAYVEANNIKLFNTPDSPSLAVAELAMGLIMAHQRNLVDHASDLRQGLWKKQKGRLLSEKVVGILGFGRIGKLVAQRANAFGCHVIVHDKFVEECEYQQVELDDLLKASDIISLHLPNTKDTHHIINDQTLSLMKKDAVLINTSRGSLIDEVSLLNHIDNIGGAALDVFEKEPYDGLLSSKKNVILTPHIGSLTQETRAKMEEESLANLCNGLNVA